MLRKLIEVVEQGGNFDKVQVLLTTTVPGFFSHKSQWWCQASQLTLKCSHAAQVNNYIETHWKKKPITTGFSQGIEDINKRQSFMATRPGLPPARLKKVYGSMPPLDKMYIYNVQVHLQCTVLMPYEVLWKVLWVLYTSTPVQVHPLALLWKISDSTFIQIYDSTFIQIYKEQSKYWITLRSIPPGRYRCLLITKKELRSIKGNRGGKCLASSVIGSCQLSYREGSTTLQ